MSDQCGRCELRGKLQDCLREDCFQHDNWFAFVLQEQLAEKEKEIEQLKEQNDKFMWQVRDTCARAEKAEAELAELRERLKEWLPVMEGHAEASHLLEGFNRKVNKWDIRLEAIKAACKKGE